MSAAILISQDIASSQPPPSAKPLMAAIVGCLTSSTVEVTSCPVFAYATDSSGEIFDMYSISAPAENAFSPSPVKMITLTLSSLSMASKVLMSSFATSIFMALSLSGLFILTVHMPSEVDVVTRDMIFSKLYWT